MQDLDDAMPEGALDALVAQQHHRLLSLEADLRERARAGDVSERAFARRLARLIRAQARLATLATRRETQAKRTEGRLDGVTDVGLPVLESCSPQERRVCEAYLDVRETHADRAATDAARVLRWTQDALDGRTNPLRLVWRLSKLRRMLDTATRDLEGVQNGSRRLGGHLERLFASIKSPAQRDGSRTTLEALMELFQRLDQTIARVAKLRLVVRREEAHAQAMTAWLRQEEAKLAAPAAPTPPPPSLGTLATVAAARVKPKALGRIQDRRRLVEQFWTDVIEGPARATSAKDLDRAAAKLGGGDA